MAIYRVIKDKENNYVMMNKSSIYDSELSFKAKGILAYCLSRPDNWEFHHNEMIKHAKDGKDSVKAGIKELIEMKYIRKITNRDSDGRFLKDVYEIYERPYDMDTNNKVINSEVPHEISTINKTERVYKSTYTNNKVNEKKDKCKLQKRQTPTMENPRMVKPLKEKPIKENPSMGKPLKEKPIKGNPSMGKHLKEKPTKENPSMGNPLKEKPIKENPSMGKPLKEKPTKGNPEMGKPLKEKLAMEKPWINIHNGKATEGKPIMENQQLLNNNNTNKRIILKNDITTTTNNMVPIEKIKEQKCSGSCCHEKNNSNSTYNLSKKRAIAEDKPLQACKYYEAAGFSTVNSIILEKIAVLVEIYTYEWVIDAMDTAVLNNRRTLNYVEGILKNWRSNGRKKLGIENFPPQKFSNGKRTMENIRGAYSEGPWAVKGEWVTNCDDEDLI